MKKAQKRFLGTALTLSTVASIVAPVAVSAATVTFAEAKAKVDAAKAVPTFKAFNEAYALVIGLSSKDDQAKLLNELSPLWSKVATKYVTDILGEMDKLAKDKNLKTYNELLAKIEANTDKEEATNKNYLLGELTAWGQSGALYTTEEKAAIDAIVKAWTDKTPANVQAAKDATAKVKNAGSLEWLNGEISKISTAMTTTITSFKATSQKTFEVKFNKAVADTAKMVLTLKRDGAKASTEKVEWNTDKTVATITVGAKIVEADYQIVAKYDTEAEVSSEVLSLDESKPVKIEILSTKLVAKEVEDETTEKDKLDMATFRIKLTNQYGEDITADINESDLKIRTSQGDDDNATVDKFGVVTIPGDYNDNDDEFDANSTVSVTVTYKPDALIATKTLTVTEAAEVASITIGDLTAKNSSNKDRITSGSDLKDDYYLPITVKDADGNVLTADEVIYALDSASSSDDDVLDFEDEAAQFIDEINDKSVLTFKDNGTDSGKVVVTVTAKNGVSATKTITVEAEASIDKLTFNSPDVTVKKGKDFVLTFNAYDQYGTQLIDEDDFPNFEISDDKTTLVFQDDENDDGTEIEVKNGTLSTQIDYSNNNALQLVITADADADEDDKLTVSVDTVTGKSSEISFSIKEEAHAEEVSIASITTKVLSEAGYSVSSLELKRSKLNLKDQFGDSILLEDYEIRKVGATAYLEKYISYTDASGATQKVLDPNASVIVFELEDGGAIFNLGVSGGTDPKVTVAPKTAGTTGSEDLKVSVYKVEETSSADVVDGSGKRVKYGKMASKSIDDATVSFEAVALEDLDGFTIDNFDKIYTGDVYDYVEDSADAAAVADGNPEVDKLDEYQNDKEAFGLIGSTKVKIPTGLISSVRTSKAGIDAYITSNKVVVGKSSTTSIDLDTDDADKTAKVTAVFTGAKGKVYTVEKEFTYNSKDPVVTTFQLKDEYDQVETKSNYTFDEVELDGKNIDTLIKEYDADQNKMVDGQKAGIRFYTKDQYGVEINGVELKISNTNQKARVAGEAALSVSIDADGKLQIANAKQGDAFTITALTNDAQYKAITITLDEVE